VGVARVMFGCTDSACPPPPPTPPPLIPFKRVLASASLSRSPHSELHQSVCAGRAAMTRTEQCAPLEAEEGRERARRRAAGGGHGQGSEVTAHRRVKRGFIVPGTLWCGSGNKAPSYEDLGVFSATDRCCREHDQCEDTILSFHSQYGVFNANIFTMSHCDCDNRFRRCLKDANDSMADVVGYTFFNLLKMHCFQLSHRLQWVDEGGPPDLRPAVAPVTSSEARPGSRGPAAGSPGPSPQACTTSAPGSAGRPRSSQGPGAPPAQRSTAGPREAPPAGTPGPPGGTGKISPAGPPRRSGPARPPSERNTTRLPTEQQPAVAGRARPGGPYRLMLVSYRGYGLMLITATVYPG
uniref:phospholipase A2 n=1 Tax=Salarias fasciatus TaxID=181472 RepID=A0A672HSB3_SALFA